MRTFFSLTVVFVLTACSGSTITLTPQQAAIRQTNNPDAVRGCRYVGPVEQTFAAKARTRTAELGGDTFYLVSSTGHGYAIMVEGEAYDCRNVPPPANPQEGKTRYD